MGKLTTHVLDTHAGRPAAGLSIELWQKQTHEEPGEWSIIGTFVTNSDGRVDHPILEGATLTQGVFELRFFAGDYLRRQDAHTDSPAFLDVVPVQFGISDDSAHYHVPLLLSAHGYSTYRGS